MTQTADIVAACTHVPDLFGRIAEYIWIPDSVDAHDWRRFQTMDDEMPGQRRGLASGASSPTMPRKRMRHSPLEEAGARISESDHAVLGRCNPEAAEQRLARRGGGIFQFLMASRTMLDIGILGIKERRPAAALNRLTYNLMCDSIREGFKAAWRRTRQLQASRSDEHDFATALEILDMHKRATIVCR